MRALAIRSALLFCLVVVAARTAGAQQFNSDSYLSKPHGMITIIQTLGQRNSMYMLTYSLFPRWEVTGAAYLFNDDRDASTDDGYSTSFYAKYMFHENAAKTGGFAVKLGTGMDPGIMDEQNRLYNSFRTYWTNAPLTVPCFDNALSVDIMPGASISTDVGTNETSSAIFTYATRLAWYPKSPTWSLVGEVVGAEGEGTASPEYRVGLRLEPNPHAVFALTYDDEFTGSNGAGWEIGMMLFTPPFFGVGQVK